MKDKLKHFLGWNGYLGKTLDIMAKHQKWWWIFLLIFLIGSSSFNIGEIVTKTNLSMGNQNIKGNITLQEALTKSKKGGRLIIISNNDARFIDITGTPWNIPGFSKNVNQNNMDEFKRNNINIDGKFNLVIEPIKIKTSDMLISIVSDLAFKVIFIMFYLFIFFIIIKHFSNQKNNQNRFKKIEKNEKSTRIKDVAGYEGVKNELIEVVDYLKDSEKYTQLGAMPPKGILLYGPPGTGKTLLAKAVAGEARATFYEQSASSFVQIYAGEGAKAVRNLFEQARKNIPSVIFIDEIDAIGGSRANGGHEERIQTLNAILTEMDGFNDNNGLVVIGATNRIDTLDEALVRPGRFDRKVFIGLPNLKDREKILQVHAQRIKFSSDVNWSLWAKQTQGFSGAYLASLINEAAIEAARLNKLYVENNDIEKARDRVLIGVQNKNQILSETEKNIVSVHEMGHALMRLYVGGHVEKVSITPRGQSLGVTVSVMSEESYLDTLLDIQNELAVLMGGRAAEKVVFDQMTGGSSDDMMKASHLAQEAVLKFGTKKWGSYIPKDKALDVDMEASLYVNEAYQLAIKVLEKHKESLVLLANMLKDKEELSEELICEQTLFSKI